MARYSLRASLLAACWCNRQHSHSDDDNKRQREPGEPCLPITAHGAKRSIRQQLANFHRRGPTSEFNQLPSMAIPPSNLEAMVDQILEEGAASTANDDITSMSFEESDFTVPRPSTSSYSHAASASTSSYDPSASVPPPTDRSNDIFYCENYFDMDDILAQSNRISVSFQRTIPKLGFLDPGAEDDKLLKGTKLELPLWIVKELNADQVVHVTVPKGYNHTSREILEADANCVNLNKMGPNFYRFGQHLAKMNLAESEDIANAMVDTFTQRFSRLVNFALSGSNVSSDSKKQSALSKAAAKSLKVTTSAGDDINTLPELLSFTNSLDNWEKDLMTIGQETTRQQKRWQNRDLVKVTANEMVSNLNKRKKLIEAHVHSQQQNGHGGQSVNGRSSPMLTFGGGGGGNSSGPSSSFKS